MTSINALYFPETILASSMIIRELFFFDHIYHYQASEEDARSTSSLLGELCRGYAPLPFHHELPRFQKLIRELKGHEREFYSGQLSAMASSTTRHGEEQVHGLIAGILGKTEGKQAREELRKMEELWQARLLLKLAEILFVEEEELTRELSAVVSREKELYEALKGDEEEDEEPPFTPPPFAMPISTSSATRPLPLLKAWAKLYLADNKKDEHRVLLCGKQETADLLCDINESLAQERPEPLLRLPLPAIAENGEEAWSGMRQGFRRTCGGTLDRLAVLLRSCAEQGVTAATRSECAGLTGQWNEALSSYFGEGQSTGSSVHLEIALCARDGSTLMATLLRRPVESVRAAGERYALLAYPVITR